MTDEEKTVQKNKELVEQYPFLIPRNRWNGKVPDDYDFSYTELDSAEVSDVWKEKLLLPMFEEIKAELERAETERTGSPAERKKFARWYTTEKNIVNDDYLHVWAITQIKEKFGGLRLYCNFYTDDMQKIIRKYEDMSERTCYFCGKTATMVSSGYILPYCAKCAKKRGDGVKFIAIDTWLSEDDG